MCSNSSPTVWLTYLIDFNRAKQKIRNRMLISEFLKGTLKSTLDYIKVIPSYSTISFRESVNPRASYK
jgi:hypothetical protein